MFKGKALFFLPMPVVIYFIYVQLFSISRLHFLYVQPECASCYSEMGPYLPCWKNTIFFLFFRVQMESILPVEQLMVLSTFLMLLLENWFTPLKVLYGLFLKACDIESCAVYFSLISYYV